MRPTANAHDCRSYRALVKGAVMDDQTFLRLTLSKKLREDGTPWEKITVRPVRIRGRMGLQFSYFDPGKDVTKNYFGDEAVARLDDALAMPFSQVHVQTTSADTHVRVTRKGKALVTTGRPSRAEREPVLLHDRAKDYLLPARPDPFLQALGIVNNEGQVRAGMQGKFHQVNEFLRLIERVLRDADTAGRTLHVVDCGCGNAYLTFAAYHYLSNMRGLPAQVIGVDVNDELVGKCAELRDSLGWPGLEFRASSIAEFTPLEPPDVVLSLHACDTATDEAIARGIVWGSRVILAAPCCQHELHSQLRALLFRPVLRHGILRERLADILTDTFRALALRIMGYRTSVIQFVSPEHTSKNLMIRAVKGLKAGHAPSVREYNSLKEYWGVEPSIERLLGSTIRQFLGKV